MAKFLIRERDASSDMDVFIGGNLRLMIQRSDSGMSKVVTVKTQEKLVGEEVA